MMAVSRAACLMLIDVCYCILLFHRSTIYSCILAHTGMARCTVDSEASELLVKRPEVRTGSPQVTVPQCAGRGEGKRRASSVKTRESVMRIQLGRLDWLEM